MTADCFPISRSETALVSQIVFGSFDDRAGGEWGGREGRREGLRKWALTRFCDAYFRGITRLR